MNENASTKLQAAATDENFAEWVREAVRRFAADHDLLDAAIHKMVLSQYWHVYDDFVAKHFPTDDGPIWVGGSQSEIELAMREDFKNTEKFRAADAWSKNGSRCLSCGRDFANRPIDLATLTEDACRTLVALYLMSLGDSVLLVSKPPDWNEWRGSDDKTESGIAWMVNDIDGPPDDRFERIGLVIERVFAEWKVAAVDLQADSENCDCDLDADSRSVAERTSGASAAGTSSHQKVSGNCVYDFHQQEVDNLKAAAVYTLAVCNNLKRMLEGVREDQPHWAARAISELLDPNYQCKSYVDKVDHLIAPVSVPVNVPRRTKMHRGPDGIHYEKKFPLTIELREEPLAHRAAWVIHDTVVTYLWSVWRRGNPTLVCCDALTATDELVGPRWKEIREELRAFADYDCDGLLQAVKAESNAAMERCRLSIVATERRKPGEAEASANKFAYLDEVVRIEEETPPLNTQNRQWITASEAVAKGEAKNVGSLKSMRRQGRQNLDITFGVDKAGRKWRKESGTQTVWYWVKTLVTANQVSKGNRHR